MSWRAPRYSIDHYARAAGLAAITGANAFSTTQPKDHLIDDRSGTLCTFAATASDHYLQLDRGSGSLNDLDRCWLPGGHNWLGWDVRVRSATDAAITAGVTTLVDPSVAYTAGGSGGLSVPVDPLDFIFTASTQRYVRLDWPNEVTINPAEGELVYSRVRTLKRGPEPAWDDGEQSNVSVSPLESGAEVVIVRGVNRRRLRKRYRLVTLAADLAIWQELVDLGPSGPLLVDPAFDTEAVVWMRIVDDVLRSQDPQAPAQTDAPRSVLEIELLEAVG